MVLFAFASPHTPMTTDRRAQDSTMNMSPFHFISSPFHVLSFFFPTWYILTLHADAETWAKATPAGGVMSSTTQRRRPTEYIHDDGRSVRFVSAEVQQDMPKPTHALSRSNRRRTTTIVFPCSQSSFKKNPRLLRDVYACGKARREERR